MDTPARFVVVAVLGFYFSVTGWPNFLLLPCLILEIALLAWMMGDRAKAMFNLFILALIAGEMVLCLAVYMDGELADFCEVSGLLV